MAGRRKSGNTELTFVGRCEGDEYDSELDCDYLLDRLITLRFRVPILWDPVIFPSLCFVSSPLLSILLCTCFVSSHFSILSFVLDLFYVLFLCLPVKFQSYYLCLIFFPLNILYSLLGRVFSLNLVFYSVLIFFPSQCSIISTVAHTPLKHNLSYPLTFPLSIYYLRCLVFSLNLMFYPMCLFFSQYSVISTVLYAP